MPSTDVDLRTIALNAVASAADMQPQQLTADLGVADLGLDSVDLWQVLLDVEDEAGCEVPAEVITRLTQLDDDVTVGGLIDVFSAWTPQPGGSVASQPRPHAVEAVVDEAEGAADVHRSPAAASPQLGRDGAVLDR